MLHVLRNRYQTTTVHQTTSLLLAFFFLFIVTFLYPFGAVIAPLLLTVSSPVSSILYLHICNSNFEFTEFNPRFIKKSHLGFVLLLHYCFGRHTLFPAAGQLSYVASLSFHATTSMERHF
jgi:hypothetical protein